MLVLANFVLALLCIEPDRLSVIYEGALLRSGGCERSRQLERAPPLECACRALPGSMLRNCMH